MLGIHREGGRGASVCRLRRTHDQCDRPQDRRGGHSAAVCRHARGLELYLCGGDLDPIVARLDLKPCARLRLLRGRDGAGRVPLSADCFAIACGATDNLKAGVTKACFYDPAINRTYGDLAAHYDTAVVPARPHEPKDKAKVEGAVLLVERWILARLRNRQFFSLGDVNAAIRPLLDRLNDKVSRHLGASRRQLFDRLDKPALKPLPVEPYVYAEWKKCRAGLDYHIAIGKHHYSVPYQLLKKELWARITARTVEAFHIGKRVASHVRTCGNGQHSTQPLPGRRLRSNLPRGAITCPRTTGSAKIGRRTASRPGPHVSGQTSRSSPRS